ncbi:MAG: glycosyltransferase [Xanthomonadales bacterium]|nr:glycosyltransferase [Xanthomonadales bacterium]
MSRPLISVVVATHNPNPQRLHRTLDGLARQDVSPGAWELVVVDNASEQPVATFLTDWRGSAKHRVVLEKRLGLTWARKRGIQESGGDVIVFVDDDNVLASDYLSGVEAFFAQHPDIGSIGGKSLPEFETTPPDWISDVNVLLAIRDFGDNPLLSAAHAPYPGFAPIGAGLAIRRSAVAAWLKALEEREVEISDRKGASLASGGDSDIVMCGLEGGFGTAYVPELVLTHLIPRERLNPRYLARLSYGMEKSWVQLLALHGDRTWGPIHRWSVLPRKLRSFLRCRAWLGAEKWIRWRGACGHFDGRADMADWAGSD